MRSAQTHEGGVLILVRCLAVLAIASCVHAVTTDFAVPSQEILEAVGTVNLNLLKGTVTGSNVASVLVTSADGTAISTTASTGTLTASVFYNITTQGAEDIESFNIPTCGTLPTDCPQTYVAVANALGTVDIYRSDGLTFTIIQQTLVSGYARDLKSFWMGGSLYLAVVRHRDIVANSPIANSYIYKWVSGAFVEFQAIRTNNGYAVESFTVIRNGVTTTGLAYANFKETLPDGSESMTTMSFVYLFDGTQFALVQSIQTIGAADVAAATSGSSTFLIFANYMNTNPTKYAINSMVYKWSTTTSQFTNYTSIPTRGCRTVAFLTNSVGTLYLVIANHVDLVGTTISYARTSQLYKYEPTASRFSLVLGFPTTAASGIATFMINSVSFFVIGSQFTSANLTRTQAVVYRQTTGDVFELVPISLPTNGVKSLTPFTIGNDQFLAASNFNEGSSTIMYNTALPTISTIWRIYLVDANTDFVAFRRRVFFGSTQTSIQIPIQVLSTPSTLEAKEYFTVSISAPSGLTVNTATASTVVNIKGDGTLIINFTGTTISIAEDFGDDLGNFATRELTGLSVAGNSNDLTWAIVGGDSFGLFGLERDGTLLTSAWIDRESSPYGSHFNFNLLIQVTATDASFGLLYVPISITDLNDNPPTLPDFSVVNIYENNAPGVVLATIMASDLDIANSPVYAIASLNPPVTGTQPFSLDSVTGELKAVGVLDAEIYTRPFTIAITATDSSVSGFIAFTSVTVFILDQNDNQPAFAQPSYTILFPETASLESLVPGVQLNFTQIGTYAISGLNATDRDAGVYGQLTYTLTDTPFFEIRMLDGNVAISIKSPIDYEVVEERFFDLVLHACDSGAFSASNPFQPSCSSTHLLMTIQDVNDNAPTISSTQVATGAENRAAKYGSDYTYVVRSTAQIGDTIMTAIATDVDSGLNGMFTTTLSGTSAFSVDPNTGLVTVAEALTADSYTITMSFIDQGTPVERSSKSITILILRGISFPQTSISASIPEDATAFTSVITLGASPVATNLPATITYSVDSVLDGASFIVGATTGILSLSTLASLNYENAIGRLLTVRITASDSSTGLTRTATTVVAVTVTDVNDNAPVFNPSTYSVTVAEDDGLDTGSFAARTLATVSSSDVDTVGGPTVYSIVGATNAAGTAVSFFTVNANGQVQNTAALDRETSTSYSVTVRAFDGVNSATTTVQITLTDANDMTPVLDTSYAVTLLESAAINTGFLTITGTDGDLAGTLFSTVTYSISPSSAFIDIDPSSGVVTLKQVLDREAMNSVAATIVASDGRSSTSAVLTVSIVNVDEFDPVFSSGTYSATIDENLGSGVAVTTVSATDQDFGETVVYSISAGNSADKFVIDSVTGAISTTGNLDRESAASYSLTVTATDPGNRFATATVAVTVADKNDNTPAFNAGMATFSFSESTTINSVVGSVSATDADIGVNAAIAFSITSGNSAGKFTIDAITGSILLAQTIDYETESASYTLEITVKDAVQSTNPIMYLAESLSSSVSITFTVTDSNDNLPSFAVTSDSLAVAEDTTVGTNVYTAYAVDADASETYNTISYAIVSPSAYFGIESATGVIYVTRAFDYETSAIPKSFTLVIRAVDASSNSLTPLTLTITIADVNDNTPFFTSASYAASIWENQNAANVVTVVARDIDTVDAGLLTFALPETNPSVGGFAIDPVTGVISATGTYLDRETTPIIVLTVVVKDGNNVHSAVVFVTVTLLDENDNAPTFPQGSYNLDIAENTPIRSNTFQLSALDADIGTNAQFFYEITSGNSDRTFSVNNNGYLVLEKAVDYESSTRSYSIRIIVKNAPTSPSSGASFVMVNFAVTEVNDNAPAFDPTTLFSEVAEGLPAGTVVGNVIVSDADSFAGGQIASIFVADNVPFAVSAAGVITTTAILNADDAFRYAFTITAQDMGTPSLSRSIVYHVRVLPGNLYAPVFMYRFYSKVVSETTSVGATFATLVATDADTLRGADVALSFQTISSDYNAAGDIGIRGSTGELYVVNPLNRELQASYSFVVRVSDGLLWSDAEVMVTVDPAILKDIDTLKLIVNDILLDEDLTGYTTFATVGAPTTTTTMAPTTPFSGLPTIDTFGGNANGANCVFPFMHNGQQYNSCTNQDESSGLYWCLTAETLPGQPLTYGYCNLDGVFDITFLFQQSRFVIWSQGTQVPLPLVLERTKTYAFIMAADIVNDPFVISYVMDSIFSSDFALPEVQNTPATSGQTVFVTPNANTPSTLWFQSTHRDHAGGAIQIVDPQPGPSQPNDPTLAVTVPDGILGYCHFPFYYAGQLYTECICAGYHEPWCGFGADSRTGWGVCVGIDMTCVDGAGAAVDDLSGLGGSETHTQSPSSASSSSSLLSVILPIIVASILVVVILMFVRARRARKVSNIASLSSLQTSVHPTAFRIAFGVRDIAENEFSIASASSV